MQATKKYAAIQDKIAKATATLSLLIELSKGVNEIEKRRLIVNNLNNEQQIPVRNSGIFLNSRRIAVNKASALKCFRSLIFEGGSYFLDDSDFFLFFLSMTFPPVDMVCHAHIKNVFVYKKM